MMPGRISFLASLFALGDYVVNVLLVRLLSLVTRGLMIIIATLRSIEYKVRLGCGAGGCFMLFFCNFYNA